MSPESEAWVSVRHRVIFGDTDAMGIVYYANYLRFFEIGRNEYLRARGKTARDLERADLYLPVIEVGARYHLPARYDDEIVIATRLESLERVRLRFGHRLTRGEDLLIEGFTVHACVSGATGRAVRMPEELRACLGAGSP